MQMEEQLNKTPSSAIKPTSLIDNDSPHRTRVFYKKYLNQVNQALQGLITAGRLKRMELMSINNRALFNRGKVQRCEWMIKRHSEIHQNFLPDIKNLNLDNRSPQRKNSSTFKRYKTQTDPPQSEQSLVDMLIEQQLNRIKKQNLLESGRKQDEIVYESCRIIQEKLMNKMEKKSKHKTSILPIDTQSSHYRYVTLRKQHRRSATQSNYSQQIESLQKKQMALIKMREGQKKYFLRKIKICNGKK